MYAGDGSGTIFTVKDGTVGCHTNSAVTGSRSSASSFPDFRLRAVGRDDQLRSIVSGHIFAPLDRHNGAANAMDPVTVAIEERQLTATFSQAARLVRERVGAAFLQRGSGLGVGVSAAQEPHGRNDQEGTLQNAAHYPSS